MPKNTQNNVVITIGKLSEGFESYDLDQIVIVAKKGLSGLDC